MDEKLLRIAARVAGASFERKLDAFMGKLSDADAFTQDLLDDVEAPEGRVIVMGLHQDLFQLIAESRKWVQRLKFLSKSWKPEKTND